MSRWLPGVRWSHQTRCLVASFNDTRLRIFGPLALFVSGMVFFRLRVLLNASGEERLRYAVVGLSAGFLGWQLARWTAGKIQQRFPGLPRTRTRLALLTWALLVLVNLAYLMRFAGHLLLGGGQWRFPDLLDYTETTGIQLFYHCLYLGIYEGVYVFQQWRKTYEEKETLLKIQWQAKFDALKNQVNPHFLFNSLNSLSSLIADDTEQAEQFVDELSRVYRYLLKSNEQELINLTTELQFIRSYFHLLKTRYREGIHWELAVEERHLDYRLPPLTLQLLIENAVKHNVILKEQPLRIAISTNEEHQLIVRNNLQRKTLKVQSDRVGLNNIALRYKLLNQPDIRVRENEKEFTVIIPLIR
ncbi:MAG: histidine kinase [Ferruginibacter sp.]|nr:histidine kinase [Cytophagales bacterium]